MKKLFICLFLLLVASAFFTKTAFANIGVGVNTGKIQVNDLLKSGMIYRLPPITVINTGDEPSDYETTISYHQSQPELRPAQNWFIFTPQKFHLDPGKGQLVEITVNLPIKTEPGNYFAYLEAHPISTVKKGNTVLGVAAASKLYFTIVPANIIYGIYYKIVSFFNVYTPWPQRAVITLLIIFLLILFKKFFNIKIGFKKSENNNQTNKEKNE